MTDTNGYVAPEHLVTFTGIPVSKLIYQRLVAASVDFHLHGYTFAVARQYGGYRPFDVQGPMQAAYDAGEFGVAPFYLNGDSSSRPADAGHSRHGFGLAVDIVTNAPPAKRNEILAAHGFHLYTTADPNHFEPDGINVLVAPRDSAFAALSSTALNTTTKEDDMSAIEAVKMVEPGNEAIFLVGEYTCMLVSDYTGSGGNALGQHYLKPGETYRVVDRPFITFHQQLVAQNRAAQALGPQMSPADFAKALVPLLPAELTAVDVQVAVEKAIAVGFVVTGTVKPA